MSIKHVARYRLDAQLSGDIPYDPNEPATYQAALEQVAEKRKALETTGASVKPGTPRPVQVRTDD